jgi:hypothetical protein
MNRIQKIATAAVALTITLVGATLVNVPLVLADSQAVGLVHHSSTSNQLQSVARSACHSVISQPNA